MGITASVYKVSITERLADPISDDEANAMTYEYNATHIFWQGNMHINKREIRSDFGLIGYGDGMRRAAGFSLIELLVVRGDYSHHRGPGNSQSIELTDSSR